MGEYKTETRNKLTDDELVILIRSLHPAVGVQIHRDLNGTTTSWTVQLNYYHVK